MLVVWIGGLVVGIVVAAMASRRAVGAALDVADALGASAGLVGVTVMAIGTDLPEIATSVMAAASGHGDVVVGDATGSALTQITLILAILLLAAGSLDLRAHESDEAPIAVPLGLLMVVALAGLTLLLSDGRLGRFDGAVLVGAWLGSLWWVGRRERDQVHRPAVPGEAGGAAVRTVGWLLVVGGAATVTVRSFVEVTDAVGVPEFVASAIVLSLGTSMPELVVDWTAIRRGAAGLAVGDLFGSSLVDSTLAVGIGPMIVPVGVSEQTVTGTLVVAAAIAVTTVMIVFAASRRRLATGLLAVYGVSMALLVVLAG